MRKPLRVIGTPILLTILVVSPALPQGHAARGESSSGALGQPGILLQHSSGLAQPVAICSRDSMFPQTTLYRGDGFVSAPAVTSQVHVPETDRVNLSLADFQRPRTGGPLLSQLCLLTI